MKRLLNNIAFISLACIMLVACEDYLSPAPEAAISEDDIFSNYENFQGYMDNMYVMIIDNNSQGICVSCNIGGETMGSRSWNSGYHGSHGLYWSMVNSNTRSVFKGYDEGGNNTSGIDKDGSYDHCWRGTRLCNVALDNLQKGMLVDATQQQKDLIKGQAHFFRAYLQWEVARAYGSIPYIDEVLAEDNLNMPRYWSFEHNGRTYNNTQAFFEKMVIDLDSAAMLLPKAWENPSSEYGRITKGAALALKAKALLFSGSPLFNEDGGGTATFDTELMQRAAEAAYEVIKLADEGYYSLPTMEIGVDMDDYRKTFATLDGVFPHSDETIFSYINGHTGNGKDGGYLNRLARIYSPGGVLGGNGVVENPTQQYVDKWEMADGTRYVVGNSASGGYDDDNERRWADRDPRFHKTFWEHNKVNGKVTFDFSSQGKVFSTNMVGPYLIHKFWPEGVDNKNNQHLNFKYSTPQLRLAEMYLIYAEAIFEATGDANNKVAGSSLSALDAVNIVRRRAHMPDVTATPESYMTKWSSHGEQSSDHPFRLLVRNERNVELAFEGHYWYDIRRWKIGTSLDKTLWNLDFDSELTTFTRVKAQTFTFEDRHYWLPFPNQMTQYYEEWSQNPGW